MIQQLILALALTCVTVLIHAIGSVYIVIPAAGLRLQDVDSAKKSRPLWTLIRLVSGLLLLHLFEMTVWAIAFVVVGMLPDFETALYFSVKSYTTVGYGDVLPLPAWRLVGPSKRLSASLCSACPRVSLCPPCKRFLPTDATGFDNHSDDSYLRHTTRQC